MGGLSLVFCSNNSFNWLTWGLPCSEVKTWSPGLSQGPATGPWQWRTNAELCAMMEVRLKPLIITLSKLKVMIKGNRMMLARVRQQNKEEGNLSLQKDRETKRRITYWQGTIGWKPSGWEHIKRRWSWLRSLNERDLIYTYHYPSPRYLSAGASCLIAPEGSVDKEAASCDGWLGWQASSPEQIWSRSSH